MHVIEAAAIGKLDRRTLKKLVKDTAGSAGAANLRYVSDASPGISRVREGEGFAYYLNGKPVTDEKTLARIRSLVLPPAWEKVWICRDAHGHLQATGLDARGRKQYKYHPQWSRLRNHTKFFNLHQLGKALPAIRERLHQDLSLPGLPQEKVLALVLSIILETGIRIGNGAYEKLYGSFGLSTLKDRHVTINGSEVRFTFKGKKGVYQDLTLRSKRLATLVRKCRDIPGKELFQYYDAAGNHNVIDSGKVNDYIKAISGGHFTAKDFRTWTGTVQALLAFRELGCAATPTEAKQRIIAALDAVSAQLGNTRAVCKKYYVHPAILDLYECSALEKYLQELEAAPAPQEARDLLPAEQVLMKILEKA